MNLLSTIRGLLRRAPPPVKLKPGMPCRVVRMSFLPLNNGRVVVITRSRRAADPRANEMVWEYEGYIAWYDGTRAHAVSEHYLVPLENPGDEDRSEEMAFQPKVPAVEPGKVPA